MSLVQPEENVLCTLLNWTLRGFLTSRYLRFSSSLAYLVGFSTLLYVNILICLCLGLRLWRTTALTLSFVFSLLLLSVISNFQVKHQTEQFNMTFCWLIQLQPGLNFKDLVFDCAEIRVARRHSVSQQGNYHHCHRPV